MIPDIFLIFILLISNVVFFMISCINESKKLVLASILSALLTVAFGCYYGSLSSVYSKELVLKPQSITSNGITTQYVNYVDSQDKTVSLNLTEKFHGYINGKVKISVFDRSYKYLGFIKAVDGNYDKFELVPSECLCERDKVSKALFDDCPKGCKCGCTKPSG